MASISTNLSVSLPLSSILTTANDQAVGSQKTRIYPVNTKAYIETANLHRRAYNLAVAKILENENIYFDLPKNQKKSHVWLKTYDVRKDIREIVRLETNENNTIFISVVSDEAVMRAFVAQSAVITKRIKNKKNGIKEGVSLSFKKKTDSSQFFVVQKLSATGTIFPRKLGNVHFSEPIQQDGFRQMAIVSIKRGKWYLISKKYIDIKKTKIQGYVCSIDPGIRTFATVFSSTSVTKYGDGFAANRLRPLAKALCNLKSTRAKLLNQLKKIGTSTWIDQKLININRRILQIENKKFALIEDLHHRVAYDIIKNNDIIFLPTFEVKQMTKKERRNINRTTVRDMLDLCHYKFKIYIKWLAKKYGKTVIDVNESYTSKTRSWDGHIVDRLGGRKVIRDDKISVDRDINGARGILIRALSKGNYASYISKLECRKVKSLLEMLNFGVFSRIV